jgi:hypothetical protein
MVSMMVCLTSLATELEDKLKFGVGRIKIDIPKFGKQKLLGAVTISQF